MTWREIPKRETTKPREADIRTAILNALMKCEDLRVVRNFSGMVRPLHDNGNGHPFRVGLGDGSADIVGILRVRMFAAKPVRGIGDRVIGHAPHWEARNVARLFALEVKRPGASSHRRQDGTVHEDDQERWRVCVRAMGGFACVVHSPEEALAAYQRAVAGGDE